MTQHSPLCHHWGLTMGAVLESFQVSLQKYSFVQILQKCSKFWQRSQWEILHLQSGVGFLVKKNTGASLSPAILWVETGQRSGPSISL